MPDKIHVSDLSFVKRKDLQSWAIVIQSAVSALKDWLHQWHVDTLLDKIYSWMVTMVTEESSVSYNYYKVSPSVQSRLLCFSRARSIVIATCPALNSNADTWLVQTFDDSTASLETGLKNLNHKSLRNKLHLAAPGSTHITHSFSTYSWEKRTKYTPYFIWKLLHNKNNGSLLYCAA